MYHYSLFKGFFIYIPYSNLWHNFWLFPHIVPFLIYFHISFKPLTCKKYQRDRLKEGQRRMCLMYKMVILKIIIYYDNFENDDKIVKPTIDQYKRNNSHLPNYYFQNSKEILINFKIIVDLFEEKLTILLSTNYTFIFVGSFCLPSVLSQF